ncbi:MAG: SMI1/KNR4 family protein [Chitinophagales bacterium]|nr:SMI1/KNR4 family protein [Chitinophagales bacterium]
MSLFDKIFGKKKPEKPSQLEKIERALNCKFPKRFHEFIQENKGKEIILELPDENYRILSSIRSEEEVSDLYEQVDYLSKDMKTHQALESGKTKLPFARNLSGDQHKYLFFEGEDGKEFGEQVFFTDMDSLIGQIEITKSIKFLDSTLKKRNETQIIIDCKPQFIQEIFENFELPNPISYWQKSFGFSSRENKENLPDGFSVQQHAINYQFENPKENIAKFEMQSAFAKGEILFFTSSAYEIDNPNLKGSIDYNVEYRTFYFKLFSIIDALMKSKEIAMAQGIINEDAFLDLIDVKQLFQVTKQHFKSIDTKEV